MKSLTKLLMMVVLTAGSALSQTSAVTATITDPDSQTWNNGTYTINFIPAPNSPGPSTWTGGALTTQFTGSLNSSGVLSVSVADNTTVSPPGSLWQFTLCPNSSAPCQNVRTQVTGASPNLSTTLSNGLIAPRFGPGPFAYGYADAEVITPLLPGVVYFNVTNTVQRIWNGSAWINGSGTGAGTVTSVATGVGLTGGPISGTGTISLLAALPNGETATTQTVGDNTTKVATDAFVLANGAGTVTAAAQFSVACYNTAGTVASVAGCLNIATDVSGNLLLTGTFVQAVSFRSTGTGTVLLCPEAADPGAPGASSDSLNCSNAYHRLTAYFNNVGPLVLGTWGITTAGGFNVGGSSQINGINTESSFAGNNSGTGIFSENSTGVPAWIALPLVVANGGTGLATLTAHSLQIGEGTSTPTQLACAAGALLVGGGASADPACSSTPVIGGVGLGTATITFSGNTSGTAVIGCANATCTAFGGNKAMQAINYTTVTNCVTNTSCGAATAGMASIAAAATTVTVSTTSVTLNSEIKLQFDATLGGASQLNVTCNTGTSTIAAYWISARTPGTSFVITTGTTPVTNPACLSWTLNN